MKRIMSVLLVVALAFTMVAGCSTTSTMNPTGSNVTQTLSAGQKTEVTPKVAASVNVSGTSGSSGTAGTADGGGTNTGTTGTGTATSDSTGTAATATTTSTTTTSQ